MIFLKDLYKYVSQMHLLHDFSLVLIVKNLRAVTFFVPQSCSVKWVKWYDWHTYNICSIHQPMNENICILYIYIYIYNTIHPLKHMKVIFFIIFSFYARPSDIKFVCPQFFLIRQRKKCDVCVYSNTFSQ